MTLRLAMPLICDLPLGYYEISVDWSLEKLVESR